jgi:hypothetical protein
MSTLQHSHPTSTIMSAISFPVIIMTRKKTTTTMMMMCLTVLPVVAEGQPGKGSLLAVCC